MPGKGNLQGACERRPPRARTHTRVVTPPTASSNAHHASARRPRPARLAAHRAAVHRRTPHTAHRYGMHAWGPTRLATSHLLCRRGVHAVGLPSTLRRRCQSLPESTATDRSRDLAPGPCYLRGSVLQARKNSPRGMSAGRARVAKACTTHTCIHSPTHLDMRTRAQTRNHTTHVRVHIHTSKSIIPHATCEHRREHRRVRLNLTYLKRTGRDPGRRDSTSK